MSFATIADLETRLGSAVASEPQAQAFLDDATAYLQSELGQLIEAGTATFTTRRPAGRSTSLYLPQYPVRAVTEVLIDGEATTAFDFVDQQVRLRTGWWQGTAARFVEADDLSYVDVTITFDYGYETIPPELVALTCVLASQALTSLEQGGSLGAAGIRSDAESIDDYSHTVTYATEAPVAYFLDPDLLDRLRSRYGAGVYVTG